MVMSKEAIEQAQPPISDVELIAFREWMKKLNRPKRIIVGISGASFQQLGLRTAEVLSEISHIETHLVVTDGAKYVMALEMFSRLPKKKALKEVERTVEAFTEKGVIIHDNKDQGAPISSGSFTTEGMIVVPCSAKTLARIAGGSDDDLLARAAFCSLKEHGRTLVVVPRETPITLKYIENMHEIRKDGGVILPPVPAFYHGPQDIQGIIDHIVGKALDQFRIDHNLYKRWGQSREHSLD